MATPKLKPNPERLLIADDEHLMAMGLASSIQSLGYEVVGPVGDGKAAVELVESLPEEERPDMALLDIRMPEMDGLSAAKILWETYRMPAVIISAFGDNRYVDQAQPIGVYSYLLKPVSSENLRVTLHIAWARASSHEIQSKRIDQLEQNLANRRTIEQAKWKLTELYNLSEAEAHTKLQRLARDNRRPIVDVAGEILDGNSPPMDEPAERAK